MEFYERLQTGTDTDTVEHENVYTYVSTKSNHDLNCHLQMMLQQVAPRLLASLKDRIASQARKFRGFSDLDSILSFGSCLLRIFQNHRMTCTDIKTKSHLLEDHSFGDPTTQHVDNPLAHLRHNLVDVCSRHMNLHFPNPHILGGQRRRD